MGTFNSTSPPPPQWLVDTMNIFVWSLQREVAAGTYTLPLKAIDDATSGQDFSVDMNATTGFQITYKNLTQSMFPLSVTIFSGGNKYPGTIA